MLALDFGTILSNDTENDAVRPVVCTGTSGNNGRGGNSRRVIVAYNLEDDGKRDPRIAATLATLAHHIHEALDVCPDMYLLDDLLEVLLGGSQRTDTDEEEGQMATRPYLDDVEESEWDNENQGGND